VVAQGFPLKSIIENLLVLKKRKNITISQKIEFLASCFSISPNVSAMSSGGIGTTHYQNTTNENRKHKR